MVISSNLDLRSSSLALVSIRLFQRIEIRVFKQRFYFVRYQTLIFRNNQQNIGQQNGVQYANIINNNNYYYLIMNIQTQQKQAINIPSKDQPEIVAKKIPKIFVKYELFPFHNTTIKNVSTFQNILVFGSGNDSENIKICRYQIVDSTIQYKQIQLHHSFCNRHNFIKWSPNGRYLATGSTQIIIWGYENNSFTKFKEFSDQLYEITAFTWCPNSKKYAASGVNNNLSIIIRNVETDERIKQIKNEHKVLGLSWDPYDKHLASLLANNTVLIYKCANWERAHIINLNLNPLKFINYTSKRQQRKIQWSSDFRFLMIPALDDKTIPFVIALDRNNHFSIKYIFTGPFSSINCIKFNPNLYRFNNEIINIFALGDNDGNISIWGIGEKFVSKKPFYLLKSHKSQIELIEDLEWSYDGKVLFGSAFKKYLITSIIEEQNFGKRLNETEKRSLLENLYGSMRSLVSVQNEFKIFKHQDAQKNKQKIKNTNLVVQKEKQKISSFITNTNQNENQELVFTEQKVINRPDGKKKMIPSMLVKKTEVEAIQNKVSTMIQQQTKANKIPLPIPENSNTTAIQQQAVSQVVEKKQYKLIIQQKLNLKLLQAEEIYFPINEHKYLEIQHFDKQSIATIVVNNHIFHREIVSSIPIRGRINYLQICLDLIIIYNSQGYIFFFNFDGLPIELPIFIGKIHLIKINKKLDILFLNTNCQMKVINLRQKKIYLKTNIFELISANLEDRQSKEINKIVDFIILTEQIQVFIQFFNKKLFFWVRQLEYWNMIQNDQYELGISPLGDKKNIHHTITTRESRINQHFFSSLLKPPILNSVQQLEYNLIFFLRHKKDKQKYNSALIQYIKQLKKQKLNDRLRQILYDHFIDTSKQQYIAQPSSILKTIFSIGGQIIEQFKILIKAK